MEIKPIYIPVTQQYPIISKNIFPNKLTGFDYVKYEKLFPKTHQSRGEKIQIY
jgi:hypothetical protein